MRAVAPLLLALAGSCAYLQDRWNDTLDIVPLSLTFGPGLYVSANATQFCGSGLGITKTHTVGWFPTDGPHAKREAELERFGAGTHYDIGVLLGDIHSPDPGRRDEYGVLYLFLAKPRKGVDPEYAFGPASTLDVGVRAHLVLVGARVTVSPGNFADWLLGWFGADIASDDRRLRFPETGTASRPASRSP